jgi:hypothetical protein
MNLKHGGHVIFFYQLQAYYILNKFQQIREWSIVYLLYISFLY